MDVLFRLFAQKLHNDIKHVVPGQNPTDMQEAFEAEKKAVIQKIQQMQLDPSSMMSGGRRKTTRSVKRRRRATKKHQ